MTTSSTIDRTMQPLYDVIGGTYGVTRRADPRITQAIAEYIDVGRGGSFLDLACGTGNYTCSLETLGGNWYGIDNSTAMIQQAKVRDQRVVWQCADAVALPFSDDTFLGAICTNAIHHFPELHKPFSEVFRVLSEGAFVLFTAFPEQLRHYWLCHYFPQMMARSIDKMPSEGVIVSALCEVGFAVQSVDPFHITNDLEDLFLYSGKFHPEIYLDAKIRANISSFATQCSPAELEHGLRALRSDIEDDRFREVSQSYPNVNGDYAYVIAHKGKGLSDRPVPRPPHSLYLRK